MFLVVYSFCAFGLAYIVGKSKISLPLRTWFADRNAVFDFMLSMIECPACFGTWIGEAIGLLYPSFWVRAGLSTEPSLLEASTFLALFTCASNLLLGTVTGLITRENDE